MPKIRKVKRSKKFKVNINRKRLRNKLRKLPDIPCKDIKEAWINTKSTRQNLEDMGLVYDANKALKIPSVKQELLQNARRDDDEDDDEDSKLENKKNSKLPSKVHVAKNLEAEAKAPRERQFRLPNQQVQFLTYMMEKYGDDYKAMTRDKKNYYQLTWRQIRSKINTFKGIPEQYAEYLLKKGEIVLDNPETLEETRKRKSEENVKKYCATKPKKKKSVKTDGWLEESIDDLGFYNNDKVVNLIEDSNETTKETVKKLQLFSDNESEDEDKNNKTKLKKFKNLKNEKKILKTEENKMKNIFDKDSKRAKALEKLESSDSESEEELEGDDDDEAGFIDLNDVSDEELSEDDLLDNGEFVTDSEEDNN